MAVFKTAGSKIYIGPTIADSTVDFVASDFSGLSPYVEIKNTTNLGDFGDTAAAITSDEINRPRTRKAKGTRNAGTMTLVCNDNPTDPGQLALYAAEQDDTNNYAFQVVLNDAPSGGTGSVRYFAAKVTSTPEGLGGANQFATVTFALDIDSNIVRVAAASGASVPVNSVAPAISGTAAHGNILTASTGTWSNTPTSFAYQWNRNGVAIANEDARDSSYTVETADVGDTLTVTVTASNSGGAGSPATSAATATVT